MNEIKKKTVNDDLVVYGCNPDGLDSKYKPNELSLASFEYIHTDLKEINKSFTRLAFHLYELKQYYKRAGSFFCGWYDFYKLCDANFGLDKTQVSRLLSIASLFMRPDDSPFDPPKMFLNDKYKDFSYSQLCEMISMQPQDRVHIKPDMTISQIREYKKARKQKSDNTNDTKGSTAVATSQQKKNYLCATDLTLNGAAKTAKLKKVDPINDDIHQITIFDEVSGDIYTFEGCSLLLSGQVGYNDKNLIFRSKKRK